MTKNDTTLSVDNKELKAVLLKRYIEVENNLDSNALTQCMMHIITELPTEWLKVICLIGGAASGKSTLAKNLTTALLKSGIMADYIGTDDYLLGDRAYRREHLEGKEPRAKYDFTLMNHHIALIRAAKENETIPVPTYDPVSGIALAQGVENYHHTIWKISVLIVEGDFDEVEKPTVIFYLHMKDSDRLQNRMHRDARERNEVDTKKIQENFQLRQITQHNRYTFPAIHSADYIIDTHPLISEWNYTLYRAKNLGKFHT